jgi:peptide-methionine (S)-S-oxide reductase
MRRLMTAFAVALMAVAGAAYAQAPAPDAKKLETATFAGGCFWCVEADFDKVDGVVSTVSGFMGGRTKNPTYKAVTEGDTGHLEVVQIKYDPAKVNYEKLLETFWRNIDPYDAKGQFCDKGDSYRTAIFTHTPEQKAAAAASKARLDKDNPLKQPIVTELRDASEFTAAEDYHQNFHTNNPIRYRYYRYGCGRDARLEQIWGKKATN